MGKILKGNVAVVKKPAPKYTPPKIPLREKQEEVYNDAVNKLTDIEKKMSPGGAPIQTYMGDLCITVGGAHASAETAPAVSVVDGWPVPSKISIQGDRTHIDQKSTPHVQSVAQSIPWGALTIVASNKFNTVIGSGGISMHTDGCLDINSGGRTMISSLHEINMTTSGGNINIICGHNINIKGDTVTIQTTDPNNQVVVNSNLGVARNVTVHGSTYVDGELYVQHITAPISTRLTSKASCNSNNSGISVGSIIGWVDVDYYDNSGGSGSGGSGSGSYSTRRYNVYANSYLANALNNGSDHVHAYYTIASDLLPGNEDVRNIAAEINSGVVGVAKPQTHGGTGAI
jgi:hypothetical protein